MIARFKEEGIIRDGHFLLTSEQHSNLYIDKDMIFRSKLFPMVIASMAYVYLHKEFDFKKTDIVTGPAVAGAVLAAPVYYEIRRLTYGQAINFVYPEKIDEKMVFRRGYDKFLRGKKVLIIEDIITTGGSVMKTAEAIIKCGGVVMGCICIWNRTDWKTQLFPTQSLINEKVESWEPESCPLCYLNEIPLTDPKA